MGLIDLGIRQCALRGAVANSIGEVLHTLWKRFSRVDIEDDRVIDQRRPHFQDHSPHLLVVESDWYHHGQIAQHRWIPREGFHPGNQIRELVEPRSVEVAKEYRWWQLHPLGVS